jgi:hypothetical protein
LELTATVTSEEPVCSAMPPAICCRIQHFSWRSQLGACDWWPLANHASHLGLSS